MKILIFSPLTRPQGRAREGGAGAKSRAIPKILFVVPTSNM